MWTHFNKKNLKAEEKGFSTYNKINDAECKIAYDWWEKNEKKWTSVRDVWIEIFEKEENISFSINFLLDTLIIMLCIIP